jgi:hypothetical protein
VGNEIGQHVAMMLASSWWTTNHVLVLTNVFLAVAALATAVVGVKTIKSSNKVAAAADRQATATDKTVSASLAQLEQGAQQLKLGEQQLEKEREALELSIRPIVVDVPLVDSRTTSPQAQTIVDLIAQSDPNADRRSWWYQRQDGITIGVAVRNIGSGPAFIHDVVFTTGIGLIFDTSIDRKVIPSHEIAHASCAILSGHLLYSVALPVIETGTPTVIIRYSDVGGTQKLRTIMHLKSDASRFNVTKIELFHCDHEWVHDVEPFATTGPA